MTWKPTRGSYAKMAREMSSGMSLETNSSNKSVILGVSLPPLGSGMDTVSNPRGERINALTTRTSSMTRKERA